MAAPVRRQAHVAVAAVWLGACVAVFARHGGQSWHFVATGARSLFCLQYPRGIQPCGLHVYAWHPDVQIGPLSLVAAAPAVLLRRADGFDLARLGMACAGLAVLVLVERGAPAAGSGRSADRSRLRVRFLLAALAFFPAWADLAVGFGHLDDVLALTCTAAAVHAVTRGRPGAAGWLLAMATLSKPWALAFLPVIGGLPAGSRRPALTRAVVPVVAAALPFLLADRGTLRAAAFRIPNAASSSLRLLGVTDATPWWDRPAQLAIGLLLGVLAVRRGRWRAAVMIAAATRIALDPQVYSYYTASVLVGTLIWDLQVRPGRRVPVWTWAVCGALFASRYLPLGPTTLAVLRLAICATIIGCALLAPGLLARITSPLRRLVARVAPRERPQPAPAAGERAAMAAVARPSPDRSLVVDHDP
ncbi:MAG TPA: hypothetical protein VI248_24925 [Kineosporiaceae bacterium]